MDLLHLATDGGQPFLHGFHGLHVPGFSLAKLVCIVLLKLNAPGSLLKKRRNVGRP